VDACPFNYLYWDFIGRHAERFGPNPRMRAIVGGWLKRTESNKDTVP
jgi:(6-4)DNA photolyase